MATPNHNRRLGLTHDDEEQGLSSSLHRVIARRSQESNEVEGMILAHINADDDEVKRQEQRRRATAEINYTNQKEDPPRCAKTEIVHCDNSNPTPSTSMDAADAAAKHDLSQINNATALLNGNGSMSSMGDNSEMYLMKIIANRSHDDAAPAAGRTAATANTTTTRPNPPPVEYDTRGRPVKSIKVVEGSVIPGAYSAVPRRGFVRRESTGTPQHVHHMLGTNQQQPARYVETSEQACDPTHSSTQRRDSIDASCRHAESCNLHNNDGLVTPPASTIEHRDMGTKKRVCFVAGGVVLAMLLVGVVILLAEFAVGLDDADAPLDPTISTQDISSPASLIPGITNSTLEAIADSEHSPQFLAYEYIRRDPNWNVLPYWKKQQRFAMFSIYYAFDGPSLNDINHFTISYFNDECDWLPNGQDWCSQDGHIQKIRLRDFYRMKGSIPPEIAFLSDLEVLDFSRSEISTELEALLGPSLEFYPPSLKELSLAECNLWGSLPSGLGQHLSSLTTLDLSGNKLDSTVPSEIGLLTELETLLLASNQLTGSIPKEVGELAALTTLDVKSNPDLEHLLPNGICLLPPMESLKTDWCEGSNACCTN